MLINDYKPVTPAEPLQDIIEKLFMYGEYTDDGMRMDAAVWRDFGTMTRYDLRKGIPISTAKKIVTNHLLTEMFWYTQEDTNIRYLNEHGFTMWDQWADENGDLGPVYGKNLTAWDDTRYIESHQVESFEERGFKVRHLTDDLTDERVYVAQRKINQLQNIIDGIKSDPHGRRHVALLWNPSTVPDTSLSYAENVANGQAALPACHSFLQFYVSGKGELSMALYQRSLDSFIGGPYNVGIYALLVVWIAHHCGLKVGNFIHFTGDTHVYQKNEAKAREFILRDTHQLCQVNVLNKYETLGEYSHSDFEFINYNHSGPLFDKAVA